MKTGADDLKGSLSYPQHLDFPVESKDRLDSGGDGL